MLTIHATRTIAASPAAVFGTVANIRNFSQAIPQIVGYEFLTNARQGVGTRFRETRRTGGKESVTELEVTEYATNEHVRIVADSHGTRWDTVFAVAPAGGQTELTLTMTATARTFFGGLLNRLIAPMVRKAIGRDLDAVKAFCER